MNGRAAIAVLLMASVAVGARPQRRPYREVTDRDVDRAIGEMRRYLLQQQQKSGHWERHGRPVGVPAGGETAIALFALMEAGEKPRSDPMRKGLDALAAVKSTNLYVVTTRAMVLSQVAAQWADHPYGDRLRKDLAWLNEGALRHGTWGYGGPERTGDNSCSQFALLALWEADRAGIEIDRRLVARVEQAWLARQKADGGWTYPGEPGAAEKSDSTLSMTAAGLASLFLCQDVLLLASGPYRHQGAVDRASAFLAENLTPDYINNGYVTFCVQRVGMASGRKFIGEMDWFAAGAGVLCEPNPYGRRFRGKWGPTVRAAFELIFLARGRIPLTFNKLQHGEDNTWNFHTRDVARFSEFMRRNIERRMRWQVVRITDDVQLLLDAPILLIEGTRPLAITDDQWAKLREYSLRGGTLLFVPTNGSQAFLASAKKGLADLYAAQRQGAGGHYALRKLDASHPVYAAYEKFEGGDVKAPMWGLGDGTRLLAVICERDLCGAWQRRLITTRRDDFNLGVNFLMYATDGNELGIRLRPVFTGSDREPRHRATVAWLRHGGNWSTQPYALEYLSQKLTAENRVAIEASKGAAITAEALKDKHLAWMTGSESFTLSEDELKALREYVEDGGTLFVNAIGGSRPFERSARTMLQKLFMEMGGREREVPERSGLLTGKCGDFRGPPIEEPQRTKAFRLGVREAPAPLRAYYIGDRAAAIFAPYGIHDTLDGHTAHGAQSYMPSAAADLAANVVLYALASAPARRPATAPASPHPGAPGPATQPAKAPR